MRSVLILEYNYMKQQTIGGSVQIEGRGLHSGEAVFVEIQAAAAGQGILFRRIDLEGEPELRADIKHIGDTRRSTCLKKGNCEVQTVEHLLAACAALGLDNLLVLLNAAELPILDGASKQWCELLLQAGITEQESPREYLELREPLVVEDEQTGAKIELYPAQELDMLVSIDFSSQVLGQQYARFDASMDFQSEIAPCRTFVFVHELLALHKAGLIRGGSLEQAAVILEKQPSEAELAELKQLFPGEELPDKPGILGSKGFLFSNEAARHKLLDLLGDLSLCTAALRARIVAHKPGHAINAKMAEKLKEALLKQRKNKDLPRYDPNQKAIYDVNEVTKRLQHRYPFLLLDKVIELSETHIVGVKNVTMNEPFFPGHFPGNPVMPGVLQIEALAQTGGIFVLNEIENPQSWDTYFLRIDDARFRQKVLPGDTLLMRLDLTSPVRRGLCEMYGRIFVGEQLVMEAKLLAQIIQRK